MRHELIGGWGEHRGETRTLPRRWWMWTTVAVVTLSLLGVGSAILPSTFTVQTIEVVDAREEKREEIRSTIHTILQERATLFGRVNLFLVPRTILEQELPRQYPFVHTVQVVRKLPSTVRVVVQESIPVALLYAGGSYVALDPTGTAFDVVPPERVRELTLPIVRDERPDVHITIGQQVLTPTLLSFLHDLVSHLPDRFGLTPREVTIPAIGAEELHVLTNEGWRLLVDSTRPIENQLAALEKIFAEEITEKERANLEYLDLRIPGKAFAKYR